MFEVLTEKEANRLVRMLDKSIFNCRLAAGEASRLARTLSDSDARFAVMDAVYGIELVASDASITAYDVYEAQPNVWMEP